MEPTCIPYCSHSCACLHCEMGCSSEACEETAELRGRTKAVDPFTNHLMEGAMTLDPAAGATCISDSVMMLGMTLKSKNQDYAPDGEFSNFERAAKFAGISVLETLLVQLEIKMTRIDNLTGSYQQPRHESLKDSFLDLAGYALIAHAYLSKLEDETDG